MLEELRIYFVCFRCSADTESEGEIFFAASPWYPRGATFAALIIRAVRLHDSDISVDTIELFDYTTLRSTTTWSSSTTLVRERNPRVRSSKV